MNLEWLSYKREIELTILFFFIFNNNILKKEKQNKTKDKRVI